MNDKLKELKLKKIELLEKEIRKKSLLPHLYGYPHYKWSREFTESTNKLLLLNSANQVGKSSTQIRKVIHWATEPSLWKTLWPRTRPLVFWYLYPSLKVFSSEVMKKWIPEFLPREEMKDHPQYGWKLEKDGNDILAIHFNSGVSVYGKSYMTNETLLQTGTVWYLAFDEEMPEHLWSELTMRIAATDGYISGVFTPTLSQEFWYEAMEMKGSHKERFPHAQKMQVSLFDCQKYEDGSPTHWTKERITQIINTLPTEDEVLRRVYGRFIMNKKGLKYSSFNKKKNVKPGGPIPKDWRHFFGIDSGSGGNEQGHPAAIIHLIVNPEYTRGRIIESWVGTPDNVDGDDKFTTSGDILKQYLRMKGNVESEKTSYDFADKDLGVIGERNGIYLSKADKSHEYGEGLLNTLFKNQLLDIDDNESNQPLILELSTLRKDAKKTKAKDNACDGARYAATGVPWNLEGITSEFILQPAQEKPLTQEEARRRSFDETETNQLDAEMEELNEFYGN